MNSYLVLIRPEEWLQRFGIIFFGYILTGSLALTNIYSLLIALVAFIGIGSFGFIINDYFDREADKRKIKNRNPISKNQVSKKSALSLAIVFGGFGLSISYFLIPQVFILFLLSFFFLTLYSAPPFRFKEKFGLDILTNAFAMPILFLVGYMLFKELSFPVFMIAFALFLLDIITGLAQEIRDYNGDKKAGFCTSVIKIGAKNSIVLIRLIVILFVVIYSLTIYLHFPIYFLILLIALLPLFKLIFSDKLKPEMPSKMLTDVNNKSHLLLGLLLLVVIFLSLVI